MACEDADALGVMVYGSGKEDKAAVEKAQRDWSELGERVKALKMEGEKEKAFEEALEKNAEALRGVLSVLWSVCWISVVDGMAFKSKSSPKRNCVTQLHDYLNKYVTYDSDVCSYELISLSSSIPVKELSISLLAAEI